METNENLIIQMASSGYYGCKNGCERAIDTVTILQSQLDNAPASFHGNIVQFPIGKYYYICTRNNNFSNRAQKGFLRISNGTITRTENTSKGTMHKTMIDIWKMIN